MFALSLIDGPRHIMKPWYRLITALLIPVLGFISLHLTNSGFSDIEDFRKLERIPLTSIVGSVDGEVQLSGIAKKHQKSLKTPHTQTPALYYRYLLEEEYEDSDGDTQWRTLRDETRSVDFTLRDNQGIALLRAAGLGYADINWDAKQSSRNYSGDLRHTEWTITQGDRINIIGWMKNVSGRDQLPQVLFTTPGNYVPIISEYSIDSAQSSMGSSAILSIWVGITASILMCFMLMFTLRRHKVVTFLALMTIITSVLLLQLGFQSLKLNVAGGAERVKSHLVSTQKAIEGVFAANGLQYTGLSDVFDVRQPQFSQLTANEKSRLDNWRLTAYEVQHRYLAQVAHFPEAQYASTIGADKIAGIALTPALQKVADARLAGLQLTRTDHNQFMILIGLLVMVIFSLLGFRVIRFKRMQENVIATKVGGVAYGLAETNGKLLPLTTEDDSRLTLSGPLSGKQCCWYHYQVKEKRGSGKDASWVTVTDEKESVDFRCEDHTGSIYVDADDAEFITRHKESRNSGNRRYYEESIRLNDQLYVFGEAKITAENKGDELCFGKPDKAPFIVSNYSEEEVKFVKGAKGLLLLSLGISLMFLCSIWMAGNQGNFSTVDFLLASLSAPALSLMMMIMFMYNDLIFLKQRCERNFANIQVALKKRFDLTPQLVRVIKKYLQHESDLQEKLAAIRGYQQTDNYDEGIQAAGRYLKQNSGVLSEATGLISVEGHPELKGNEALSDLHKRLIHLENEVELIREGFNHSVTEYNTRIEIFPDVLIAKLFKFDRKRLIQLD